MGKGTNYMAGFWKSFGSITLDVEGYFRQLDGAIIHATQTPGLRPTQPMPGNTSFRLFQGYSQSYGTDVSLAYEKAAFFPCLRIPSVKLKTDLNKYLRINIFRLQKTVVIR